MLAVRWRVEEGGQGRGGEGQGGGDRVKEKKGKAGKGREGKKMGLSVLPDQKVGVFRDFRRIKALLRTTYFSFWLSFQEAHQCVFFLQLFQLGSDPQFSILPQSPYQNGGGGETEAWFSELLVKTRHTTDTCGMGNRMAEWCLLLMSESE